MSGLTRISARLSAEWISTTVTTDPPRLTPHDEWSLVVRVETAAPVRAVVLLYADGEMSWGLSASGAQEQLDIPLKFHPSNWRTSDEVGLHFGWRRLSVVDPGLKIDPRGQSNSITETDAATGQIIPVCELRNHPVTAALFVLAGDDTEQRRNDRWRVRPELTESLPTELSVLTTGQQSGTERITTERPTVA